MTAQAERTRMVSDQLVARGIEDPRVLAAMEDVARERFVPRDLRDAAYEDTALPIPEQQTISQPYVVAWMCEALRLPATGEPRVLEVGTGSGYQAAVLAAMGARVITVERHARLAADARAILAELGYGARVVVVVGDGSRGWPDAAPYGGIVVAAAAPRVPGPLVEQLGAGARLVVPLGGEEAQTLVVVRRDPDGLAEDVLGGCRFVKLVGECGFAER